LPTAFFKSFAENEVFEAAPLKDPINTLKFETMGRVVGAGSLGHYRDGPERKGVHFGFGKVLILEVINSLWTPF
jgi:hypothetical protein